jgi:protein unc-45
VPACHNALPQPYRATLRKMLQSRRHHGGAASETAEGLCTLHQPAPPVGSRRPVALQWLKMTADTKAQRVNELIAKADSATNANDASQAASILREASSLDPGNIELKRRWLALQTGQRGGSSVEALRTYIRTGREEDGRAALSSLNSGSQISTVDARDAYDLLINAVGRLELTDRPKALQHIDALTSILLNQHEEARRLIAARLVAEPTAVFEQLYGIGDLTFKALTTLVLGREFFATDEKQVSAQQDVFRLCISTLIEAGVDRPERAMRAITHQLAVSPQNVASILDEDVVDIVLSELDIRLDPALHRHALLAASKMLETTKEQGEKFFADFITARVAKQTNEDLIIAFSAAAAVFPILPVVAAKLFMTDGFVQQLVPNLEKNSDAALHGQRKSQTLEQAALELLSAACVDKACREAIKRYCSHWLNGLAEERQGHHKALAALVLAKVGEDSVEDVTAKLSGLVLKGDDEKDQAIEGLAYTTLQPKVKELIAYNAGLLKSLAAALKDRPTATFGALTVFANLTAYRPVLSAEQKKMTQLQAYANSSKVAPDDPLEDEKHVSARCKQVLATDIVPAMVACCKPATVSISNIALVVRISLSLAKDQKCRAKMAQQGAVKLLLQIRQRITDMDKRNDENMAVASSASHALARLLISINPAHIFSSALPASSAVTALTSLLVLDSDAEQRNLLPTFECLLALTNLASMDDPATREVLIRSAFSQIEDLLFSSHTLVQRASVELVCNLMASPQCIALFADGSPDSKRRMIILLALTDVDDLATRRAAGGALAMLTEWDIAVTALLDAKDDRGPRALLGLCSDQNAEVVHRGLVCVSNAIGIPGDVGKRCRVAIQDRGGSDKIKEGLKGVKDREVLAVGIDVLKTLG